MDQRTGERVRLHRADAAEAERIVARSPAPSDRWAEDFPFEGDVVGATMFLRGVAAQGDPGPFGHYVVVRAHDGLAVGGAGFKGRPEDGVVEIGYGLAPSGRGQGLAADAVRVLVGIARDAGVTRVVADTDRDNVASQRTLERAGFDRTGERDGLLLYALDLTTP